MPAALRWLLRLGPTNPIAVRLVQGGSRRQRHLYIRTAYLAILIAVLMWSLLVSGSASGGSLNYRDLAAAGAASFAWTARLQVFLICVLTPVFMAGAIAQEANPRTWDILCASPLSAVQIVLGILFGRLFFILALLFASLPLFAVTQYFGGAPGGSILASYAVAAAAALIVGAIAVALSVSRLAGRRAVFTFYVAVISYLAATAAIDLAIRPAWGGVTPMTAINPFLALESLIDPAAYPTPEPIELAGMSALGRFWLGSPVLAWIALSVSLSVFLMIASALLVRRVAAEGGARFQRRLLGIRGKRGRSPKHVWQNPIAWREAAARANTLPKLLARWSFVGAGVLWAIGVLVSYHRGALDHMGLRFALLATVWTELAVIALVAMNMAGAAVSREREDGTLDLILVTPVTPSAYLAGKLRGVLSYIAPLLVVPICTVALVSLYVLGAQGGIWSRAGGDGAVVSTEPLGMSTVTLPVILPEAALVVPLTAIPFMAFCVMVGLQWSLKSKSAISSVIATVGVVVALAGLIGACGWMASREIPVIGPVIGSLNPASALFAAVSPATAAAATLDQGMGQLRTTVMVGAVVAAIGYSAVVYGMLVSMVRTFDMTVRRLAGLR